MMKKTIRKEVICTCCKKPITMVGRNVCNKCIEKAVRNLSKTKITAKNKYLK